MEQPLFGDASVVLFLMADLQTILETLGNRGYRVMEFEAGVKAGKVYLSSFSQKLGASGSTFYDDAVTKFFSPHALGKSVLSWSEWECQITRFATGTILGESIARELQQ